MNSGRHSTAESLSQSTLYPPAPLRLALPDEGEERRRAALYGHLLHREEIVTVWGDHPRAPGAPPLRRGRMVPEPIGEQSVRRLVGRVLRRVSQAVGSCPRDQG